MSAWQHLSPRVRIAVAGVTVAGLGLGVAPLASASTDVTVGVPIMKVAATYQGVPYRWGGTSTHGFDCSGYVQFVFRKLGVKLPRTAEEQYEAVKHIKRSELKTGDLVFFGGPGWVYHVGIYAGHNMFWDAPHSGSRVQLQKIWAGSKVYGRVRGLHLPVVAPSPTGTPSALPVLFPATGTPPVPISSPAAPASSAPTPGATAAPTPSATATATSSTQASPTASPSTSPAPSASTSAPAAVKLPSR